MQYISAEFTQYLGKVAIPFLAMTAFLFTVPRNARLLRIFSMMLLFVLLRDAMTPTGLWKITENLELRFINQPITLWFLAISSLGIAVLSRSAIGSLGSWNKKSIMISIAAGLSGGFLVALLPFIARTWTEHSSSNKPEELSLFIAIAALAFFGNFLEEALFRGHFQNYLNELKLSNRKIILLSGGAFSICHSFLAFTVTIVGWPILKNKKFPGSIFIVMTDGDSADDKYILFKAVKDKVTRVDEDHLEPCGS